MVLVDIEGQEADADRGGGAVPGVDSVAVDAGNSDDQVAVRR
jgi:hypothetical protein